jgi:ferredoxin-NADP reductase
MICFGPAQSLAALENAGPLMPRHQVAVLRPPRPQPGRTGPAARSPPRSSGPGALAAARSSRDIWWLHGARRRADEPFAAESRALLAALPSAHRHVRYSSPGPGDMQGRDYQTAGRLSAPVLAAMDPAPRRRCLPVRPPAFMADVSAALAAADIQAARIRTEVFGAGPVQTPGIAPAAACRPHPPAGKPGSGPLVAFARSDLNARWDPGYASLLEFAEACDVPVRWSCRT